MKLESADPNLRSVVSPEGVSLPFELGSITDRLTAFGIDFVLSQLTAAAILLVGFIGGGAGIGVPLGLIASFLIRNFYFAFFEIRWNGSTPGKRRFNLRVISRDGGPVTAEAIFARNLTRDIEVFYPLVALSAPASVTGGLPGWATAIAVLWLLTLAAFPLFGRDRLRIGDLLGGTLVVRMPGGTGGGRRVARTVQLVDLFPTFQELLGIPGDRRWESGGYLHGTSLVPDLVGDPEPRRPRPAFTETGVMSQAAVVSGGWKLIELRPAADTQPATLLTNPMLPAELRDGPLAELEDAALTQERVLLGHNGEVTALAFSADGATLHALTLRNDPQGDADFWRQAVVDRIGEQLDDGSLHTVGGWQLVRFVATSAKLRTFRYQRKARRISFLRPIARPSRSCLMS